MVVTIDSSNQALRRRKVDAGRAEVPARGGRRIEDVLRVRGALTNRSNCIFLPRGWQELHRSDCTIECCVAIQDAVVGVGHCGVLVAIK